MDAKNLCNSFKSDVTLLGPIVDMNYTVNQIDKSMKEIFNLKGKMFKSSLKYLFQAMVNEYKNNKKFNFTAKNYSEQAITNFESYLKHATPNSDELGFYGMLSSFSPESLGYFNSNIGLLSYWISKAEKNNFKNFRMLGVLNDSLNFPKTILEFPEWFKQHTNLLIIKNGGHSGFVGSSWFTKFFNHAFPAL